MKKLVPFFIALFFFFKSYSQTYIEIIRASSYYSNAVTSYSEENYENALSNLLLAEKSLKGKTNRDLEYLKIMSNYHLNKYKEAFKLTSLYFENGYTDRKQSFRNVISYGKMNGINYEEELTSLFVFLEEKSTTHGNTNDSNLINAIVNKIKKNKISLSNFLDRAIVEKVTQKIDYCLREVSNGTLKRIYENNFLTVTKEKSTKKSSYYFTGTLSGKAVNTSKYKFEVSFATVKSVLTSNQYSYGYTQHLVKHLTGSITLNKPAYQCYSLTAPQYKNSYFSSEMIKSFQKSNFIKKGFSQKKYRILFSPEEVDFLRKGNNLTLLNTTLRSKGLL